MSEPLPAVDPGAATPGSAVVVPMKSFASAKGRLADALDEAERSDLARTMAARVLAAAAPLPVAVVCDDVEVAAWAESAGAEVIWTPGLGLDGAVSAGVDVMAGRGVARVAVVHADLPFAAGIAGIVSRAEVDHIDVVLVPDRHHDGTNVAVVPTNAGFRFAYGPGSLAAHTAEARRLGLRVAVVDDEALGWDVDRPDDLEAPAHLGTVPVGGRTAADGSRTVPVGNRTVPGGARP